MKHNALTIISIIAAILCYGATNNLSAQSPYDVDNTSGKYVDMSKPILITMKFEETDPNEALCEYCRFDDQGRIIEYGCLTGQFDYESYVRMFKIHYSGKKIDSIQWKEVISGYVSEKMDLIFKKGTSFYDQFAGDVPGYIRDTETDIKDLDTKSIASMRAYAESKNDILERQFGRLYDFSTVKWDKEEKDEKLGLPIYSELENDYGDEYESYILAYSYTPDDYTKKIVFHKKRTEFDGDIYETENNYIITEKYLHTNVDPRKGK
ncbi:MAG: hypothetical protein II815_03520 [Bacteroidales bacterium]|nr:hypothetical protein [Bacteroidales bacterium]